MKKIGKFLVQVLSSISWAVFIIGIIPGLLMLGFTSLFRPNPEPEDIIKGEETIKKSLSDILVKISDSIQG